jgi:AraC family transcriptional regulator of adaptative response / DNA-3-methyladenine glycosylase II
MNPDFDARYRALCSRDRRFDGLFFIGVTSTGVYCRPSCPAITPKRSNVRFYPTAAAAQGAGFRACLRCRPHATPGSPYWNQRSDVATRAIGLIADGVIDREGVGGLARRLAYSERHLHRQLRSELGAGPLALARAQRAQTARMLIESTGLRLIDVAEAAGFSSVRQFNETIRSTYGRSPTELRRGVSHPQPHANRGMLTLQLPYRDPLDWQHLLGFLSARAVPGVEEVTHTAYRRTLRLPHGHGVAELSAAGGYVECRLRLSNLGDLAAAVQRCRRLLDLDADPMASAEHLAEDPLLAPLVSRTPGMRVPGAVDGPELAIRAVLGQQVSVPGARTSAGHLTSLLGEPLPAADGRLTHLFPTAAAIASCDPATLKGPMRRRRTLQTLCQLLAEEKIILDPASNREEVRASLLAIPGIGTWTSEYIAMRALADPDAFLPSDLAVRRTLEQIGGPSNPKDISTRAQSWRPWRSYAVHHLWAHWVRPVIQAN